MMVGREDYKGDDLMVFDEIFEQLLERAESGDMNVLEHLTKASTAYLRNPSATMANVMGERIARVMEVLLRRASAHSTVNVGPYR